MGNYVGLLYSAIFVLALLAFIGSRYKKVRGQGWAMVVNGMKKTRATFSGCLVWPVIDKAEDIMISDRKILVKRIGQKEGFVEGNEMKRGLSCMCGVRTNIIAAFYLSFPKNSEEAICNISNQIPTRVLNSDELLGEYLAPIFNEALKTCVGQHEYESLITDRNSFANAVQQELDGSLCGLELLRVSIEEIQHSSLESHDPDDLYDAKGIEKITKITSDKLIEKTRLIESRTSQMEKEKTLGIQAREALMLEQHEARESARSSRETRTFENNKQIKLSQYENELEEERSRIEKERIVEQELENKRATVEQAQVDVTRKVDLAKVLAESAVNQSKEEQEQELVKRRAVTQVAEEQAILEQAEIRARRVEVERGIAVQEEDTADLRTSRNVERQQVEIVGQSKAQAEADATARRIKSETEVKVTNQDNERRRVTAETDLAVKESEAKSIERLAQARIEEEAAAGMASAKVEEARGLSQARVRIEEAKAEEALGMAKASAEEALRKAMDVDPAVRQHELALSLQKVVAELMSKDIEVRGNVGIAQADAMGSAYAAAEIKIFGGANDIAKGIINQHAEGEVMKANPMMGKLMSDYQSGDRDLAEDIKDMVSKTNTGDLLNMQLMQQLGNGNLNSILTSLLGNIAGGNTKVS